MTRKEALTESIRRLSANHGDYTLDIHKKFIDEIYDDFESRICDRCSWYTGYSCGGSAYEFPCGKGFGCNKFIKKDNNARTNTKD